MVASVNLTASGALTGCLCRGASGVAYIDGLSDERWNSPIGLPSEVSLWLLLVVAITIDWRL